MLLCLLVTTSYFSTLGWLFLCYWNILTTVSLNWVLIWARCTLLVRLDPTSPWLSFFHLVILGIYLIIDANRSVLLASRGHLWWHLPLIWTVESHLIKLLIELIELHLMPRKATWTPRLLLLRLKELMLIWAAWILHVSCGTWNLVKIRRTG